MTTSVLVGLVAARRTVHVTRPTVALASRTANRPAQEFGLLVLLLREAVAAAELVTTRLLATCFSVAFGALLMRRLTTVLVVATPVMPLVAVAAAVVAIVVVAIVVAIAVAIAVLIVSASMTLETLALRARLMVVVAHLRLRVLRLHLAVIAIVVAVVVAVHLAARHTAVHPIAALRDLLIADGHDDAVVVLGMLQVVLGQHWVARCRRIAGERHVFLGDV